MQQKKEKTDRQDFAAKSARLGARVASLHGFAGVRKEVGCNHHAQEIGHTGSSEKTHEAEKEVEDIYLEHFLPSQGAWRNRRRHSRLLGAQSRGTPSGR